MGFKELSFQFKSRSVGRSAGALLRQLERNQHLPPDELATLQDTRAAAIASFAFHNTPFYRDHYTAAGISARDLTRPEAWQDLPPIDRTIVKEQNRRFRSVEATDKTYRQSKTGGSTGQPLIVGQDRRVDYSALSWRLYRWWGVEPWDNSARVGRWTADRKELLRHSLIWWPTRQTYLDARLVDSDSLARFTQRVRRIRPRMIEGYVGILAEFVDYLIDTGQTVPAPLAVGTTAAPLTEPVRQRIQDVLRAPVYDQYRSAEIPWMAGECREQNGLHVFSDMRRIEVLGPDGRAMPPGEPGDIVVTDLANRVFPLIRYRLGDRGVLDDRRCPCGITLPLIRPPDGRTIDLLRFADGSTIGHGATASFSEEPEAVRAFQVHQLSDYSIVLRVVPSDDPQAAEKIERVAQRWRERVAGRATVHVETVEELPSEAGKTRYVISDAPPPGTRHE